MAEGNARTYIRTQKSAGRIKRRALTQRVCDGVIKDDIVPGCEIFGVNGGQFSMIDIIETCLSVTGPADVVLSTWTAGGSDIDFAMGLIADGRIRDFKLVVDFSFPTRQPEYCAAAREQFGDDAIRITKVHAKFVTITNDDWSIVIRSSMNFNENRRLETFEISDDRGMVDFLHEVTDELWRMFGDGEQFDKTPQENMDGFEDIAEALSPRDIEGLKHEKERYFNDGQYENDLRRTGWTTQKGKPLDGAQRRRDATEDE